MKRRGYRVVSVSLYYEEADEADRVTAILKRSGWHKANRSQIIREAVARLGEELAGKSPEDIFRYFIDRFARRAASPRRSTTDIDPHDRTPH
jgi:hypothetical protein